MRANNLLAMDPLVDCAGVAGCRSLSLCVRGSRLRRLLALNSYRSRILRFRYTAREKREKTGNITIAQRIAKTDLGSAAHPAQHAGNEFGLGYTF